jgi:hypothetical protein
VGSNQFFQFRLLESFGQGCTGKCPRVNTSDKKESKASSNQNLLKRQDNVEKHSPVLANGRSFLRAGGEGGLAGSEPRHS